MPSYTPQPLVSVLIPVYNGTEFLDETIRSILKSTYANFEIILVDDGSTDRSKHKCLSYARNVKNIHYYGFTTNQGMTRCLNYGAKKAKGRYIARINQDDVMMPIRLENQVQFLESHPDHVVIGSNIDLFTPDNPEFDSIKFPQNDHEIRNQWLLFSPFSDPTVMYRRESWKRTEGYSQYFWPADDVHMWYQLGALGKMANLDETLTRVRWHSSANSLTHHRRQMIKTWQVHNWAAEMVRKPTFFEKFFWFIQLIAGYVFPARFNWWMYRIMRKAQQLYLLNLLKALTLPKQFLLKFEK